jgi:DNA-binding CsgD family transcriptional regulator
MSVSQPPFDVAAGRRVLTELRALHRAALEREERRHGEALVAVSDAVRRLGELGSHDGVLARAAPELGEHAWFDRVIVSAVRDDGLVPQSVWLAGDAAGAAATLEALRRTQVRLEYPLIDAEVAQAQGVAVVDVVVTGRRSPRGLAEALGWSSYVVVALALGGRTIGLLHADATRSGRAVDDRDAELAAVYADGLAGALERAALRDTLRRHREELRSAVGWLSARLGESGDEGAAAPDAGDAQIALLTPRELEVLLLLARGRTNAAIAKELLISEATAKYHVKNILGKLQASTRADAVARYLRSAG